MQSRFSYRALVGHLLRVMRDEDQPLARPALEALQSGGSQQVSRGASVSR
jgi:hypothetical protein